MTFRAAAIAIALLTLFSDPPSRLTGEIRLVSVGPGETLASLSARAGIERRTLARDNKLKADTKVAPGDSLILDNRHIVPSGVTDAVVVNIPQRMLFVMRGGEALASFPVAVGRPDWRTPLGAYQIAAKEIDPVWDVPVSIQREMAQAGRRVLTRVPAGANNPLGPRWIGLSAAGVGIHGTNQPSSIYGFVTHGCIRLHSDDAVALFDLVDVGTPVEIVYEPVLVAIDQGEVFLEVHPDPYRRVGQIDEQVAALFTAQRLGGVVDTKLVQQVIAERAGRAEPIRKRTQQ